MLVYDVGGGGDCCYADAKEETGEFRIVGVDIEDVRIKENAKVDEFLVADITKEIPLPHGKIDMLTSSSVLEHLSDQTAFVKNARASLKDGGVMVHVFPSKFALFALLNQIISNRLARKILFFVYPNLKGANGFRTFYDKNILLALSPPAGGKRLYGARYPVPITISRTISASFCRSIF